MVLIDTHVLLWMLFDDSKLTPSAISAIENDECCVSIASFWEMAVKLSIGKLRLPKTLAEIAHECKKMGIDVVGISLADCDYVQSLPFIHRDPFDRIILSHASTEGIPLVTHDANIRRYNDIEIIW